MNHPRFRAKACRSLQGPGVHVRSRAGRAALAWAALVVGACGGGVASVGGSGGVGGAGGGDGAASDCASALEGARCASPGATCRATCPDPCSPCGFLSCAGGVWTPGEDGPKGSCTEDAGKDADTSDVDGAARQTAPCGPSLTCTSPGEYCEISGGGPPPPPDAGPEVGYACRPTPPSCAADPTCACLSASTVPCTNLVGAIIACTGDGGVTTVSCAYP